MAAPARWMHLVAALWWLRACSSGLAVRTMRHSLPLGAALARLSLRGGGQRKSAEAREHRRRKTLADEWKRQGLDAIDPRSSTRSRPAAGSDSVTALRGARQKNETFAEFEARMHKPAWKLAELRRRSQEAYPWARWGKKWREELGVPAPEQAVEEEDDSDLPEGWPRLYKINDGKGNMRFPGHKTDYEGVDDIPANLTDINERLQWFEENMVFWNRDVEFEDLVADQKHTAEEKAQESLRSALKVFHENLNVSMRSALEQDYIPAEISGDVNDESIQAEMDELVLGLRSGLRLNPQHVETLATYGAMLHMVQNDVDGAEYMFKRALAVEADDPLTLAAYARLLRDERLEYDAASRMIKRALEKGAHIPFVQQVASDKEWQGKVSVTGASVGVQAGGSGEAGNGGGVGVGPGGKPGGKPSGMQHKSKTSLGKEDGGRGRAGEQEVAESAEGGVGRGAKTRVLYKGEVKTVEVGIGSKDARAAAGLTYKPVQEARGVQSNFAAEAKIEEEGMEGEGVGVGHERSRTASGTGNKGCTGEASKERQQQNVRTRARPAVSRGQSGAEQDESDELINTSSGGEDVHPGDGERSRGLSEDGDGGGGVAKPTWLPIDDPQPAGGWRAEFQEVYVNGKFVKKQDVDPQM